MLKEELIKLATQIQRLQAEAQTTEVKAAHEGCPTRLYDTLSGFSNQDSGGTIVFGLNEKTGFEAVGVYDLQDLQKKVTEQCNQMEPPVRAVFTFAEYQGVYIASAEIPSIDVAERPCYYRGTGRVKGSYVRVGDADLPMTDYEIYSYEAYRKHLHDDERQIERAALSVLNKDKIDNYLREKKRERPQFGLLDEAQMYEMLNITRNGIPTLAAVLNFGIYPQGLLPQMAITAIVVPGYEIGDVNEEDVRFVDNKRICGTLEEMVEDAVSFCKRNMKVKTIIDEETGRRADRMEYPIKAIREAILNAVIHRDYSTHTEGTPIQLNIYRDRLEIHSPGNLYGRMTVEQLGVAKPGLRNPALAVMTESLTGAENRYSGIPTIRREMKKAGLCAPVFENRRGEFVVTLYNENAVMKDNMMLQEDIGYGTKGCLHMPALRNGISEKERILDFCREPRLRSEIAEMLGIKTTFYVMEKYVAPLVEAGQLAMTIPEKPKSRYQRYYTV